MSRNDVFLLWPVEHVVVKHHEPQRRVHRGGPAGCIKDVVEVSRRDCRETIRQPGSGFRRMTPGARVGQLCRLLMNCIHDLLLAVTRVNAPHAARTIQ